MKFRVESLENKFMDLNNTIKNTVSVGNFEREMKLYNSELTQMIDHNNT